MVHLGGWGPHRDPDRPVDGGDVTRNGKSRPSYLRLTPGWQPPAIFTYSDIIEISQLFLQIRIPTDVTVGAEKSKTEIYGLVKICNARFIVVNSSKNAYHVAHS